MKRFVAAILAVLAVATFASTASATGPLLDVEGLPCIVLDGEGDFVLTFDSRLIVYASGKVTFHCEAAPVSNSSGKIVRWDYENTGLRCFTYFDLTTNWTNKVSRIGGAQLDCQTQIDLSDDRMSALVSGTGGLG